MSPRTNGPKQSSYTLASLLANSNDVSRLDRGLPARPSSKPFPGPSPRPFFLPPLVSPVLLLRPSSRDGSCFLGLQHEPPGAARFPPRSACTPSFVRHL